MSQRIALTLKLFLINELRQYLVIQVSKINLPLIQIITTIVCINLLRSGERIGSTTHWQPTKSPENTGLENRCQFLLRCKTEDNKLNF